MRWKEWNYSSKKSIAILGLLIIFIFISIILIIYAGFFEQKLTPNGNAINFNPKLNQTANPSQGRGNGNIGVINNEGVSYGGGGSSGGGSHHSGNLPPNTTNTNSLLWRNQKSSDADNIISQGESINLSAEGFDSNGLHSAWLATNETGVWKNYTNNVIIWEDHDFWADFAPGAPEYNYNYTYKNITNTLMDYGMHQVLGVIPNSSNNVLLSSDQQMVDYLNSIKGKNGIEIALHGNTHDTNEFQNLGIDETEARLQGGIDVLYNSLGVRAMTFIPPNGAYNNSAIGAFATKGFTRFSTYDYADLNPYEYNTSSLLHVPITTEFINWNDESMYDAATIEASCQASLDANGICVLILHHNTFKGEEQRVNQTRYQILLNVIAWAKAKQDVDFKTTAQTSYIDMHDTPESMGDLAGVWVTSNFPWQSSVVPAGTSVGWRIYYTDTSGNVNMTDIKTFRIEAAD